jgi:hypothetical protein
MLIYKDGIVDEVQRFFPNTSFAASGPSDEFLSEHGAYRVNTFKPHDPRTQKLVSCAPYLEGGWAYTVTVESKAEDEVAADTASRAARMRAQRDRLLAASDWTQVADAPVDKAAWAAYRQALRDLPQAEGFPDVALPHDPNWVEPVSAPT